MNGNIYPENGGYLPMSLLFVSMNGLEKVLKIFSRLLCKVLKNSC